MDIITIILIVVTCTILGLGFSVIHTSREKLNRLYFLNIVTIIAWAITMIYYRLSSDFTIIFWTKALYVAASMIASNFLYFTYAFPRTSYSISNKKKFWIFLPNIILIFFVVNGDWIITGSKVNNTGENFIYWGSIYPVYVAYILFYFNFAFYRLINKFRKAKERIEKIQLGYVLMGYMSSGLISFTTNLILPSFGYFTLNWVGQVSTILMAVSAGFAIVKHRLFNSRVIATEFLVFILWIILLVRTMISESLTDIITNGITLVVTFFVGLFLIRSVIREVEQREKLEKLSRDLGKANTRLLELDKQKSEFVSFATHQLRAPLTAMKGYASLILEGDLGTLNKEVREAIGRIFDSSKTLANIVDDYLNISRIELGTMKYSFDVLNMKELVESVIGELKPNIERSGLEFAFATMPANPEERFMVHADKDKFKQVIANLIDNSIKYTPKGSLSVTLSKNTADRKITFAVKDTGVGIAPEVMPKLFAKFVRADNANKQNIYGTGLGLFVAKEIVTAHKGRIWAESDGDGKGSTFFLEMDMEV